MSLRRRLSLWALTALTVVSCLAPSRTDKKTQVLLDELDGYLALREAYAAKKQNQLDVFGICCRPQRIRSAATSWK